jgi:hypothetical protein
MIAEKKKTHTKLIKALFIVGIIIVAFSVFAVVSLNKYYDKNTWATLEITDDTDKPSLIMENLGKEDVVDLTFAKVTIERVRVTKGISIATDADIIYQGNIYHSLTLREGEQCIIKSKEKSAVITLTSVYGY